MYFYISVQVNGGASKRSFLGMSQAQIEQMLNEQDLSYTFITKEEFEAQEGQ